MKEIIWATNFNQKLCTKSFLHIDFAPSKGIPESAFPQPVLIKTKDNSASPAIFNLLYFIRVKMENINDTLTLLSHGVVASDFIKEKMDADVRINWQTEMALYMYSNDERAIGFYLHNIDNKTDN